MHIEIRVNAVVIASGRLARNATARDFSTLLPMSLPLADYETTEKIAVLPRALTTGGAPPAWTPVAGDVCFYAPWGNLAVFYRDGVESDGLALLGRLVSGVQALQRPGPLQATIALARPSCA